VKPSTRPREISSISLSGEFLKTNTIFAAFAAIRKSCMSVALGSFEVANDLEPWNVKVGWPVGRFGML
jgi:hypothetical protein